MSGDVTTHYSKEQETEQNLEHVRLVLVRDIFSGLTYVGATMARPFSTANLKRSKHLATIEPLSQAQTLNPQALSATKPKMAPHLRRANPEHPPSIAEKKRDMSCKP